MSEHTRRAMRDEGPRPAHVSSELRSFDRSLPMALMRARESVMGGFRPQLAAHGLTEQQWRVLRALDATDEAMSVGALSDATFLLGPSLSRMLVTLQERGLVERWSSDDDARRTDVTISESGRALVAAIAPSSERWYARIEGHLGPDDLDTLHDLLDRLAAVSHDRVTS